MAVEDDVRRHEERLNKLDTLVDQLEKAVAKIEGSTSSVEMILKWVVIPLLIILGGLVGIKLILP